MDSFNYAQVPKTEKEARRMLRSRTISEIVGYWPRGSSDNQGRTRDEDVIIVGLAHFFLKKLTSISLSFEGYSVHHRIFVVLHELDDGKLFEEFHQKWIKPYHLENTAFTVLLNLSLVFF